MQKYAILESGSVKAVQLFKPGKQPKGSVKVTSKTGPSGVGFTWDGSKFSEPPKEPLSREESIALIKKEASRRIESLAPIWKQLNAMREGDKTLFESIDAIRKASNDLEAMDPIPEDIRSDSWWP